MFQVLVDVAGTDGITKGRTITVSKAIGCRGTASRGTDAPQEGIASSSE